MNTNSGVGRWRLSCSCSTWKGDFGGLTAASLGSHLRDGAAEGLVCPQPGGPGPGELVQEAMDLP